MRSKKLALSVVLVTLTATLMTLVLACDDNDPVSEPPTNIVQEGQIVYTGPAGVHLINPDGTGELVLTMGMALKWSPDGTKVLFYSSRDGWGTIDKDGTNRSIIRPAGDPPLTEWYEWSPNGERILFAVESGADAGIYVVDADGRNFTVLIEGMQIGGVAFSPDGNRIAYVARDSHGSPYHLYLINADGTDRSKLTEDVFSGFRFRSFSWSPDGKKITAGRDIVSSDGTNRVSIGLHRMHVWAPDGKRIYHIDDDGYLSSVNPDGTGRIRLVRIHYSSTISLSPDGTRVVVNLDEDSIGIVNVDTNDVSHLAFGWGADWSR